jgi:hypothetical protein
MNPLPRHHLLTDEESKKLYFVDETNKNTILLLPFSQFRWWNNPVIFFEHPLTNIGTLNSTIYLLFLEQFGDDEKFCHPFLCRSLEWVRCDITSPYAMIPIYSKKVNFNLPSIHIYIRKLNHMYAFPVQNEYIYGKVIFTCHLIPTSTSNIQIINNKNLSVQQTST